MEIIHMRTLHVGPEEILVALKLAVAPTDRAQEVATVIDETESRIRAAVPEVTYIFIEPDVKRPTTAPSAPQEAPSHES
jgi:divalent metal cation (Fe/Co/Zn/Cd) transporter